MGDVSFCGIQTFLRTKTADNLEVSQGDFQIIGFPYDCGTSYRSGTRIGPSGIRKASLMLTDGVHPIFKVDVAKKFDIRDYGDISMSHSVQRTLEDHNKLKNLCSELRHPIVLGGDHSLAYSTIAGAYLKYGPVNVLHFDAHCDLWTGDLTHGTFLRHLINENVVNKVVQIGIRSPEPEDYGQYAAEHNVTKISARSFNKLNDMPVLANKLVNVFNGAPTYLTFDIDCLDPSEAPGTGTPESGGIQMWKVLDLLEGLKDVMWIGMDLVEVSPPYDCSDITSLAAATVIWTYICSQGLE